MKRADSLAELSELVGIFHRDPAVLGAFRDIDAARVPQPFRDLLAHEFHMTVVLEKFHSSRVDVEVLETRSNQNFYSRKILLRRRSDQQVVLFGIVRLDFSMLGAEVAEEIRSQTTPLGRILIQHDLLRRVELLSLYEVDPTSALATLIEYQGVGGQNNLPQNLNVSETGEPDQPTEHSRNNSNPPAYRIYGRTAVIHIDESPVIELLEIAANASAAS